MSEDNVNSEKEQGSSSGAAKSAKTTKASSSTSGTPKARKRTASRSTSRGGSTHSTAKKSTRSPAKKATSAARSGTSAARSTAKTAEGSASSTVGKAAEGAGRAAVSTIGDGKALVGSAGRAGRKAVHGAVVAWGVLRARKLIAAGAGAGVAVAGACFAAGRLSAVRGFGPLTRATGGRI